MKGFNRKSPNEKRARPLGSVPEFSHRFSNADLASYGPDASDYGWGGHKFIIHAYHPA